MMSTAFSALFRALAFEREGTMPVRWQGWSPREHARRWRDDLGLVEDAILIVVEASRRNHPEAPD